MENDDLGPGADLGELPTPIGQQALINQNGQRNGIRFEGTEGWIWVRRGALGEPVEDPIPRDFVFGARFESTRPW